MLLLSFIALIKFFALQKCKVLSKYPWKFSKIISWSKNKERIVDLSRFFSSTNDKTSRGFLFTATIIYKCFPRNCIERVSNNNLWNKLVAAHAFASRLVTSSCRKTFVLVWQTVCTDVLWEEEKLAKSRTLRTQTLHTYKL